MLLSGLLPVPISGPLLVIPGPLQHLPPRRSLGRASIYPHSDPWAAPGGGAPHRRRGTFRWPEHRWGARRFAPQPLPWPQQHEQARSAFGLRWGGSRRGRPIVDPTVPGQWRSWRRSCLRQD